MENKREQTHDAEKPCGLILLSMGLILALLWAGIAGAAGSVSPYGVISYAWDSRSQVPSKSESGAMVYSQTIQVPDALWIRLRFGDTSLGAKSFVRMTSLEDQGDQRLDSQSIADYGFSSAFFNGAKVLVEVFADPSDENVFLTIDEVVFGEPELSSKVICGGTDDRIPAIDPAVGRFVYDLAGGSQVARCSAWIASSGAYVTAGHCFARGGEGDPDLIEFNVPLSNADGTPNFADPDDQYPVNVASVIRKEAGTGDDYAVFDCNANSDTGLLPVQGQNDFFRPAKVSDIGSPGTIRITGYGVDDDDGIADDQANRTLQTHAGPYITENIEPDGDVSVEYQVDTMSGNSGGPVIINGTETAIGVHAHGGCNLASGNGNHGTSFGNEDLEAALGDFFGINVEYVDVAHPIASALEDGTVFKPYDTVLEAVDNAANGAEIRIVNGTYSKAAGNTFTLGADKKSMILMAPVGSVIIGN